MQSAGFVNDKSRERCLILRPTGAIRPMQERTQRFSDWSSMRSRSQVGHAPPTVSVAAAMGFQDGKSTAMNKG